VRSATLWARLLGVEQAVVERVEFDQDAEAIVVAVRPRKGAKRRCGKCGRRCPGVDRGEGRRRWRALDLGTIRAYLEAEAPRVCCPEHGAVVVAVPWARHGAGHTHAFDDTAAWLAVHTSKQAVRELLRVAWATVGRIVARVAADAEQASDRFAGLSRIGIDEISYKRGHRYLTVVVDHDTRRLVWAAPGHDTTTLGRFFDALGPQRCEQVRLVSADAACVDRQGGRGPLSRRHRVRRPVPRGPSGPATRWTRSVGRSGTRPDSMARRGWLGSSRARGMRCGRIQRT
jgi:transposase